jgi:hypothetical protein
MQEVKSPAVTVSDRNIIVMVKSALLIEPRNFGPVAVDSLLRRQPNRTA